MNNNFIERIKTEYSELEEKHKKLDEFLNGNIFKNLSPREKKLLLLQEKLMFNYLIILVARIEYYENKDQEVKGNLWQTMRDDNKLSITLPNGDFEYDILKGEGIQNIAIKDNEEFECSSCSIELFGQDGYRYYENDIMCIDCFEDGDLSE